MTGTRNPGPLVADTVATCISYGVRFRLRAASPQQLRQMLQTLPHGTTFQPTQQAEAAEFTWPTDDDPAEILRRDLMVHVADNAPDYVFLHAGVVFWQGRGLVLPGASFAGKTTLVAALVRAGALYCSDEYAVLDPAGLIHPYARSLQVRVPGFAAQTATPVAELNGRAAESAVPAALVAFVEYGENAAWDPQPVTPGMAVLEMLRHTIPVQRTPARVLATLAAMVAPARILCSPRAEAEPAAHALLALVEAAA